ncbi:uncharacterized protein PITG_14012 [Phytophthora infestans T30-4]|uniref:Uncharacterized protein n=1 Tax=Phytophthora infestans (strain T30-4) TaxID=403677 RepID=D0NNB6_PHYIT|nr:uncharacterized protein PITG_14012 [Phytophthora infestans T30-4]EEY62023.1 hypothetical protein PITG_14012 [Phytophthora infestans T30-4]|eukprot:XP_002899663.1 hypothetical protein PITG_14012 [Phytophthora infestans T30-4]
MPRGRKPKRDGGGRKQREHKHTTSSDSPSLTRGYLRRHHLIFRAKARQGQIYPSDASTVAKSCRVEVLAKVKAFYIDMIYNVDQTPIFFVLWDDFSAHWTNEDVERARVDDLQRQLNEASGHAFKLTPPDRKKVIGP